MVNGETWRTGRPNESIWLLTTRSPAYNTMAAEREHGHKYGDISSQHLKFHNVDNIKSSHILQSQLKNFYPIYGMIYSVWKSTICITLYQHTVGSSTHFRVSSVQGILTYLLNYSEDKKRRPNKLRQRRPATLSRFRDLRWLTTVWFKNHWDLREKSWINKDCHRWHSLCVCKHH